MNRLRSLLSERRYNFVDTVTACLGFTAFTDKGWLAWQPWLVVIVGTAVSVAVEGRRYSEKSV